ncbi:MAG: hypothetical protein M3R00_04745, partial [Pseudomonadota bacterium]|nr:hypothetical protein [Pseudomonadota bacterium]
MFKTEMQEPIPHDDGLWELDVPNDHSCFFWATALGYLLPCVGNLDELQKRSMSLLGSDKPLVVQRLVEYISQFNPFDCKNWFDNKDLQIIMQIYWRNRVIDYMQHNKDVFFQYIIGEYNVAHIHDNEQKFQAYLQKMRDPGMWAGNIESYAASLILGHNIHFITGHQFNTVPSPKITLVPVNATGDIHGPVNHYHFKLSSDDFLKIAKQDQTPLEDDKLPADLNFENLSIPDSDAFPSYVLNVPVVISSDSNDTSSEELEDATFQFQESAFNDPKATIRLLPPEEIIDVSGKTKKNHQRGQVDPAPIDPIQENHSQQGKTEKILSVLSST